MIALNLGNVVVGDLAYLQFLVLGQLANGASVFINTVRDAAKGEPLNDPPPPEADRG